MASKSKRRGRVFRASCILAALIIAGSSFAWFTSKDEVTNRLTASSDYGVSIVESFTPPKNWLPGQEINKDVYSVNTGNVDAFVKEDIAGVLNYTYETRVTEFGTATNKYVELNRTTKTAIDGVTDNEAGGFLAWTNALVTDYSVGGKDATKSTVSVSATDGEGDNEKTFVTKYTADGVDYYAEADSTDLYTINDGKYTAAPAGTDLAYSTGKYPAGSINSRRQDPNGTDTDTEDPRWTPPASGDYIFRRSIKDDNGTTKFTYAGYHYDADTDKYYKIAIGSDEFRADESGVDENGNKQFVFDISADSAAVGVPADKDGILLADPLVQYVIESEVKNKDVTLTYHDRETANDRDYLLVTYSDKQSADVQVDELQQKYLEAKAAYEAAKALSDQDTAKVTEAEVTYRNAEGEYNLAKKRYLQSKADFDYATTLAEETNKLIDAAKAYEAAEGDKSAKHDLLDAAWNDTLVAAVKVIEGNKATMADSSEAYVIGDGTNTGLDDDASPIASAKIVPTNVRSAITADSNLSAAADYVDEIDDKWEEIKDKTADIKAILDDIDEEYLSTHTDALTDHMTSAELKGKIEDLNEYLADLQTLLQEYYDLFANLEYVAQNASTDTVTDLIVNAMLTAKTNISAFKTAVASYNIDDEAKAYEDAYDAYKAAYDADTQAASDWVDAVAAYNAAVGTGTDGAGTKYISDIAAAAAVTYVPNKKDFTPASNATGDSGLNKLWSAGTAATPTINADATYNTYAAMAKKTLPDANTFVANFVVPTDANPNAVNTSNHAALKTAYEETTKDTYDSTKEAYENAQSAKDANADDTAAKKLAMGQAKTAWESGLAATSTIKLRVYLDENWKDNWTMDPDTDGSTDVDFYLNKILAASETSAKLIDGVELDSSVGSKDYKNLTFDLNVGLDSIQATYDADQRGYTTEAVDNDPNFAGMTATVNDPLVEGSSVTWEDVTGVPNNTTPKTYSATATNGTNTKDVTITKVDSVTIGDKAYTYKIVDGTDVYYGQATTDGAVFKKVADDTAETKEFASPAATFTLTAAATENT